MASRTSPRVAVLMASRWSQAVSMIVCKDVSGMGSVLTRAGVACQLLSDSSQHFLCSLQAGGEGSSNPFVDRDPSQ